MTNKETSGMHPEPKRATHGAKAVVLGSPDGDVQLTPARIAALFPEEEPVIILGTPGKTGLVVENGANQIIGAVRSPQVTPRSISHTDTGSVVFGGNPTEEHLEKLLLREVGVATAKRVATELINAARETTHLPFGASIRGSEVESFRVNKKSGKITAAPPSKQEELIQGMVEVALPPAETIERGMLDRARHVIKSAEKGYKKRKGRKEEQFLLNTSVPIVGSLNDPGIRLNTSEAYRDYIVTTSTHLKSSVDAHDPYASQLGDHLAKKRGYKTLGEMIQNEPNMDYWVAAAGHHSISLPHIKGEESHPIVPTEIAIATADTVGSDMGKIAELLMYSAPLMFSEAPPIQTPEGEKHPLDYRDIWRYILPNSEPGELIRDPQTLHERQKNAILEGKTHTVERAASWVEVAGESHVSFYGPLRLRSAMNKSDPDQALGRIEATGAGSSFSLLDEYARDVFLDVLKLAAFEAIANGQHPSEYFKEKYPSLTKSNKRREIGNAYNFNGPTDPTAGAVIDESLSFLNEMADKYPAFAKDISVANARITNLKKTATAQNFTEYAENPVGPVSQVMQNMHRAGKSPLEIAKDAAAYELRMAQALIETGGDAEPLVHGLKRENSGGDIFTRTRAFSH